MSGTRVCIGWYRAGLCMYRVVSGAGLVYVLGGNMSRTLVCIGW